MDTTTQILIVAAPVVTLVIGYFVNDLRYKKGKKIYFKLVDTLVEIRNAWEDDKITYEEMGKIITAGAGLAEAAKS
jgi:hypothetical protein